MWTYCQSTGGFYGPSGNLLADGYSGHGAGKNNPAMEADPGIGPIPAGLWKIGPAKTPIDHLGPLALPLSPMGFDPHGRSAFFIHGDYAGDVAQLASCGCIILAHAVRLMIAQSGDRQLKVTP